MICMWQFGGQGRFHTHINISRIYCYCSSGNERNQVQAEDGAMVGANTSTVHCILVSCRHPRKQHSVAFIADLSTLQTKYLFGSHLNGKTLLSYSGWWFQPLCTM